eukprot:3984899-Amphidinium_carterae.1
MTWWPTILHRRTAAQRSFTRWASSAWTENEMQPFRLFVTSLATLHTSGCVQRMLARTLKQCSERQHNVIVAAEVGCLDYRTSSYRLEVLCIVMMRHPWHDQEQLGYIVQAAPWICQHIGGLTVIVQGNRLPPQEWEDGRILLGIVVACSPVIASVAASKVPLASTQLASIRNHRWTSELRTGCVASNKSLQTCLRRTLRRMSKPSSASVHSALSAWARRCGKITWNASL